MIPFELMMSLILVICLLYFLLRWLQDDEAVPPKSSRHSWAFSRILGRVCYCSFCSSSSFAELFCDSCGLASHNWSKCLNKAERRSHCKEVCVRNDETLRHHWVQGNLPPHMICSGCGKEIDILNVNGFNAMRCAWCQRCYHRNCRAEVNEAETCDLGEFRSMIIPPTSLMQMQMSRGKILRDPLARITPPNLRRWEPLIVIGDTKSGNTIASDLISLLRGYLHPMQLIDANESSLKGVLKMVSKLNPYLCRILISGGDSFIASILNAIHEMRFMSVPAVAIMPSGTTNNLSHVLGWGDWPRLPLDPVWILRRVYTGQLLEVDRFDVQIGKVRRGQREPPKIVHFYSNLSVGVDALVAFKYLQMRESTESMLRYGTLHKLIHFGYAAQEALQCASLQLEQRLELHLDDRLVRLPKLLSIVFLNVDYWGTAGRLCQMDQDFGGPIMKNSFSDGILEVFGIVSYFHLAQVLMGISKPVPIGQGNKIKLRIKSECPLQVDGEPWVQSPTTLIIKSRGKARMLITSML